MSSEKTKLVPKLRFPEFQVAGGWDVKPFQKLFTIGSGRDYKHLSGGNIPVYGSGGYMLSVDDFLYDGESVCIGRKGTINNPMFLTGKFWTVDTLFYTHSFRDCLPKFIYAIFQNIDWLKHNEAGGVPSLSKTIIEKIQTAIPGTAEQQKIADCLSSLDELIAAQGRKVEALKTHKKGLMQQLFPREGETQPRLRFPEFQDAGPWKLQKIGSQLVEAQRPIALSDEAEYRLVTVKRRYGGLVSRGVMKGREILVKSQFLVNMGDFLISKRQIVHNACGLVPAELDGSVVSNEYSVLTPKGDCSIEFFSWFAMQPSVSASFMNCSVGIVIEKMLFKLPAWLKQEFLFPNLQEQERIASCLGAFDGLITSANQELDTLKMHKKGLMQQLFPAADALNA